MKNLYKKIISITLSISILVFGLFVPNQKTEAAIDLGKVVGGVATGFAICYAQGQLASLVTLTTDALAVPTNGMGTKSITASSAAKECGFDYAANELKQELIKGILKSTTEWVKGGFEGKPAFLTNPDQFLEDATDQYVANIIENNEATKVLCNSFRIPLKFAINLKFYSKPTEIPTCTMSDIEQNIDNALGDLKNFYNQNGELNAASFWDNFIDVNTNSSNNAYGAYIELSDDLERLIGQENKKKMDDVNRNGGFMSIERCDGENTGTYAGDTSNRICGQQLTSCLANAGTNANKQNACNENASKCIQSSVGKKNCEYVTPGKVISEEVSSVLGMERENIQLADEFDELIAALITQLMSKVFDSNSGLSGVSDNDINGGEQNLNEEKKAMLRMYSIEAYDIELKIYQSTKRTLNNFLNFADKLEKDWGNKEFEFSKPADEQIIYRKKIINAYNSEYQKLIQNTIDTNREAIQSIYDDAVDNLATVENRIARTTFARNFAIEKTEELKSVKTKQELWELFVDEDGNAINPANIQEAYSLQRSYGDRYESKVNGKISNYSQEGALRSGGLILSKEYLESFNRTRCVLDTQAGMGQDCAPEPTDSSVSWNSYKKNTTLNHIDIKDSYDPLEDIEDFNNSIGDEDSTYEAPIVDVDIEEKYWSFISSTNPSMASGKAIDNWKDFFEKEEKTIINPYNDKNGKDYLAFLKDRSEVTKYDSETGKTYTSYNYDVYEVPVNHFAVYPDGMGDDIVNGIRGQGAYQTDMGDDGVSWESYRVFIPPFAKKFALLFKSQESNSLYRTHLTYGPKIDHRGVKALEYKDTASDSKHSSLKDLFQNKKTVLLNILNYNDTIGVELEPGINNMGIVLDGNDIKKYIGSQGGWLYIDIIKDNYAIAEKPVKKTYLETIYYIDVDRESDEYKNWDKDANTYLKTEEVEVAGIDKK